MMMMIGMMVEDDGDSVDDDGVDEYDEDDVYVDEYEKYDDSSNI